MYQRVTASAPPSLSALPSLRLPVRSLPPAAAAARGARTVCARPPGHTPADAVGSGRDRAGAGPPAGRRQRLAAVAAVVWSRLWCRGVRPRPRPAGKEQQACHVYRNGVQRCDLDAQRQLWDLRGPRAICVCQPCPQHALPPTAWLQDRQAEFVMRCIRHLQQLHGSRRAGSRQLEGQPFRLVLVAYSMGGVVARDALRRLSANPSYGERLLLGVQMLRCTVGAPACKQ